MERLFPLTGVKRPGCTERDKLGRKTGFQSIAYVFFYVPLVGFPGGSYGKESAINVGDLGSIACLGRSPGEGNGNPLQVFCLENPKDRGTWQASVHGISELDSVEQLTFSHFLVYFSKNQFTFINSQG